MTVNYLSLKSNTPKRGYWDYGLLDELFAGFDIREVAYLERGRCEIVVIPGRHHFGLEDEINKELSKLDGVVLFVMGDEENIFEIEKINHPNIEIWIQNPRMGRHDKYHKLGCGYPPAIREFTSPLPELNKTTFFSGQNTHSRRAEMFRGVKSVTDPKMIIGTDGFTQGMLQQEYYQEMSTSCTALCPSGPETVDTFRIYEALQLGAVPIADTKTPTEDMQGFWTWLFGESVPFPEISDWASVGGIVDGVLDKGNSIRNECMAFWLRYKTNLRRELVQSLITIGTEKEKIQDALTVVVPLSPSISNPDISITKETIDSIRYHFPDIEIMLTFDGIRDEQIEMGYNYSEFIRSVLWEYRNDRIRPYIFTEHKHQIGMMRHVINDITTPLVLYVESDTPIVIDEFIDWGLIKQTILGGESNMIRLHHEGVIPKDHEHLMLGASGWLMKTVQWSQRPHIASTAFYNRILNEQFTPEANCFIEDVLHGKVLNDWARFGNSGWQQWKLHIYYPDGNIKRSYHLDQRKGGEKYDSKQIW